MNPCTRSSCADAGATASEDELLDWCRDRIAGYKRPRALTFIREAEMPRTATGKIQHRLLRALLPKQYRAPSGASCIL